MYDRSSGLLPGTSPTYDGPPTQRPSPRCLPLAADPVRRVCVGGPPPPSTITTQKSLADTTIRIGSRLASLNWKSSPTKRLSRNIANEEWSEVGSEMGETLDTLRKADKSKIDVILEKSKKRLAERDVDHMKTQSHLYEKHIKGALNAYFNPLEEKFSREKANEGEFVKEVKEYILSVSGEQYAEALEESDNLLCKSLNLADQLSILSDKAKNRRLEKLKVYIAILASQLSIQNQKYRETKQNISLGEKEKKFLQAHHPATFQSESKLYQLDKSLSESKMTIHIHSINKLRHKQNHGLPSWSCEIKADGLPSGKSSISSKTLSPTWKTSIPVKLSTDLLFETLTVEVYECSSTPVLAGQCFITLQEVLENTLFNKTFRVKLPIAPVDKLSMGSFGEISGKDQLHTMTEQEFEDYIQNALLGGNNIGLLKVSFEVNLDPSFEDIIQEIRAQRLENLEIWDEENRVQVEEQLELLRISIAPINTLEIDANMGIKAKDGIKIPTKGRFGCSCGLGSNNLCNLF